MFDDLSYRRLDPELEAAERKMTEARKAGMSHGQMPSWIAEHPGLEAAYRYGRERLHELESDWYD